MGQITTEKGMCAQTARRHTVILAKAATYAEAAKTIPDLLDCLNIPLRPGEKILLKPNLLRADMLTCSNATVTAVVCRYFLDHGCRVTLGDSPGFGTAQGVAKHIGLNAALAKSGCSNVPLISLDSPVAQPLTLGGHIGLSRHALETDRIINLPRLKAHSQMRVTASVKNLFGCISGLRKAFVHAKHGDKKKNGIDVFSSAVADIPDLLPPVTTLLDGVETMHVTGPSGGRSFPGRFLAASSSPVALDTVVYSMLGASPQEIPLWFELQRRNASGAFLRNIAIKGVPMETIDLSGFRLPPALQSQSFYSFRLIKSTLKRIWAQYRS